MNNNQKDRRVKTGTKFSFTRNDKGYFELVGDGKTWATKFPTTEFWVYSAKERAQFPLVPLPDKDSITWAHPDGLEFNIGYAKESKATFLMVDKEAFLDGTGMFFVDQLLLADN